MKTTELIDKLESLYCRINIKRYWIDVYIDTKAVYNWQCMRIHYDKTKYEPLHLPAKATNLMKSEYVKTLNSLFKSYIDTPIKARGPIPLPVKSHRYYLNDNQVNTLNQLVTAIGDNPATDELKSVKMVINEIEHQRTSLNAQH